MADSSKRLFENKPVVFLDLFSDLSHNLVHGDAGSGLKIRFQFYHDILVEEVGGEIAFGFSNGGEAEST